MSDGSLPGGFVNSVVRVGDTVRRRPPARAEFVHRLLRLFEQAGWDGAPRFLGLDAQGREMLGFVPGHVAWEASQPAEVTRDESLGAGLRPVAFIDWDLAAPGERIHDVAYVCWQYLRLGPEVTDTGDAARGMRLICAAYGLGDRDRLVDVILWWQDRCRHGIEAAAAAGDPAMRHLRDGGAVRDIRAAHRWVEEHREELTLGLK